MAKKTPRKPPPTRPSLERIEWAHDMMHAVVCGELPELLPSKQQYRDRLRVAHDLLAWFLGYPCGENVEKNLELTKQMVEEFGYTFVDQGEVISYAEAIKRGLVPLRPV